MKRLLSALEEPCLSRQRRIWGGRMPRLTTRAPRQTQSCVLCASERLRDVEAPARALYRARGLRRIGRAEIPVAGEVGNIGYLAQLVRLPCLSIRTRGTLWTSHRAPLGEEMWNSGNSAEAQRGMRCPGSWTARKNALEKLRAAPIDFGARPCDLVQHGFGDAGREARANHHSIRMRAKGT